MSVIAWLFVGLTTGFMAHRVIGKTGSSLATEMVIGVTGALVGGFLFTFFGYLPPEGLDLYNIILSFIGAVVVLLAYHAVIRRRAV